MKTEVICIASGKGGVGKTSVSINLAVALSRRGRKVLLFDADLGLANCQIALGVKAQYNFSHFLAGNKTLKEILVPTEDNVTLIPGASGDRVLASLGTAESGLIVSAFSELDGIYDYMIIDAAAGLGNTVMMFLEAAHHRFVVLNDDPSSTADAYGIVKVMAEDAKKIEKSIKEIYLIPNRVESQERGRHLFSAIDDVCSRFLGQPVSFLHSVEEDGQILEATRSYKSVLSHAPSSIGSRNFRELAEIVDNRIRGQLSNQGNPQNDTNVTGGIQFFVENLISNER